MRRPSRLRFVCGGGGPLRDCPAPDLALNARAMTTSNKHPDAPWRNFYGRVRGKTLKASQETYLDEDLV